MSLIDSGTPDYRPLHSLWNPEMKMNELFECEHRDLQRVICVVKQQKHQPFYILHTSAALKQYMVQLTRASTLNMYYLNT